MCPYDFDLSLSSTSLPVVIAKVFRQADTEESGSVDPALVPALAIKVLGNEVKESEKQMIHFKAQSRTGEYTDEGCPVMLAFVRSGRKHKML